LSVSAPDRSISKEILSGILEIEKEAYIKLRVGVYSEAEDLFEKELGILMQRQESEDRPIHKGSPLHMIGICLLYQEKTDKALRFFLLAYIEDTLNVGFELESEADLAPASLTLRSLFGINVDFLKKIKDYVRVLKSSGKWAKARDPLEILSALQPRNLLTLCRSMPKVMAKTPIDPLPGVWEKRVFVGGDYDHLAVLKEIQDAVIRSGFQPILPYDFMVPPNLIHHHDLMLLHCCRLGIFEVSSPAGQLMEIERAKDYDVEVILFYTDRDGPPHSLTSMVLTAGYRMQSYSDISDLKRKVMNWLATK
jgi:tetratricopeptide (TPR) repeat protein